MNVIVTGGSGFLGSHLVRAMVSLQWHVTILCAPWGDRASLTEGRELVRVVRGGDLGAVFSTMGPVDLVIHTATCYGRAGEPASAIQAANVNFPMRLLELAAAHSATLFCNTDSVLPRGANAYALSKKQFVEWLRMLGAAAGIRVLNVVLDQFYGPGERADKFVTWLTRQCLEDADVLLTSGSQKRRFLYIDDLVEGYIAAIHAALAGGGGPFVEIPIGATARYRVREVAEKIHTMTASRAKLRFGALPLRVKEPAEGMNLNPIRALGWRERVSIDEGLAAVIEFERRRKS